jgi:hypothetical protein
MAFSFPTKAARNSWELPNSLSLLLMGAKHMGTILARYGVTFWPAGKLSLETSWRVQR